MDHPPGQEPVALGLDCGSVLPADNRAARVELLDALAAGIRHNPDSILMHELLDSSLLTAPRC